MVKKVKGGDVDVKFELKVFEKIKFYLDEGELLCLVELSKEELVVISYMNMLMFKLIMYIVNVDEDGFENNFYLDMVKDIVLKENVVVVVVCVLIEFDIVEFDDEECDEFM